MPKKFSVECNTSFFAGVLTALLSGIALFGWHVKSPLLIQLHPAFSAMKYNASLSIVLMGLSLVLLNAGFKRIPGYAGLFIALLGTLTLCEYAFDLDFGIDQLLMKDYLKPGSSHPGRYSINAAVGYSLIGFSLAILGLARNRPKCRYCVVGALGAMAVAVGAVALLGYFLGLPATFRWGMPSNMIIVEAASTGLVLAGVGTVSLAWSREEEKYQGLPSWLPVLLAVGMGAMSICMGQALIANEYEQLKKETLIAAKGATDDLAGAFRYRAASILRFARLWESQVDEPILKDIARSLIADNPDFRAIAWVDSEFHVRWAVSPGEAGLSQELDLSYGKLKFLLDGNKELGKANVSEIELGRDGKELLIHAPVFKAGVFDGFIICLSDGQSFIGEIFDIADLRAYASIFSNKEGKVIWSNNDYDPMKTVWFDDVPMIFSSLKWNLRMGVSPESEIATKTFLPEAILVLGLLASALMGTSTYYAQRARARADQLDAAYKELKSKEELLDVMVKHLPVGIFMADIEGKCTYLNEFGCSLIGVSLEDVKGDGWANYIHPDDRLAMFEKWQSAVRQLAEFHFEFRFQVSEKIRPSNRFYVHSIPLKNIADEVTGFAGTLIETTHIKEIEVALKNTYEQLEKAQSFSKVMVCHVGLDGTWIKVSPALCEVLGYSESELIGKHLNDATHPEDFLSSWEQCEKLIRGEIKSFDLEIRCVRKDWVIVWAYLNCSIVEDAQGHPLHLLVYIINIDDKKRMKEVQESRDRLRQLAVGIQTAQEDERTRIAREIHDDLGQALTLTKMGLVHIEEKTILAEPELSQNFNKLYLLIDNTMQAMRRIITGLRPPVLDDFGLSAAIDWHAGEFQAQSGIECDLNLEVVRSWMDMGQELALFRIYQEAMTNIVRHAKASRVAVSLGKQGDFLELDIKDDGCGIPQSGIYNSKSSGILGMYERASMWGWDLKVQGRPREGTQVLVRIPLLKGGF